MVYKSMMWDGEQTHPTLTCNNAGGGQRMPDKENFNGILEIEQMEEEKTYTKEAHPMNKEQGQGYRETDIAKTLNCFNNGEKRAEEVVVSYEHHPQDSRVKEVNVSPCPGVFGNSIEGKDTLVGYDNHPNDSRITEADGAYQALTSRCGTGGGNTPMAGNRYAVRRITPIEAERLMGFPDGWTIPCFKPEDITDELCEYFRKVMHTWDCINAEEGKTPKMKTISQVRKWLTEISQGKSDSPRYKACGNSMCVNCMEWIGERVEFALQMLEK